MTVSSHPSNARTVEGPAVGERSPRPLRGARIRWGLRLGVASLALVSAACAGEGAEVGDEDISDSEDASSALTSTATNRWVFSDVGTVSSVDHFVEVQVAGVTDAKKIGAVVLRKSSADTFVGVGVSGTRYLVSTVRGGVQTVVVDKAFPNSGRGKLRAEVSGTTLKAYFGGTLVDSRTISALSSFTGKTTGLGLFQDRASAVQLARAVTGNLATGTPAPTPDAGAPGTPPPGDVLPGTGGCSCQRPALVAGAYPTATNVGACGSFKKSYSGRVVIDDSFIATNGGSKVIDSIQVSGGIDVVASGVTLCNFKADGVKISGQDVRIQDGTMISTSSLFVNYAPGSSGLATRLYVEGGSADAIRVGVTASGKTQAVTQSYFTEIGKNRSASAHCDLVQTYPVPTSSQYHSSFISQNYFSSSLYAGTGSGRAVNAIWMAMGSGARFEDNLVDRVFQGFWFSGSPQLEIHDNLFNEDGVDGLKYLTCDAPSSVKNTNNFWFKRVNGRIVKGAKAPTCN